MKRIFTLVLVSIAMISCSGKKDVVLPKPLTGFKVVVKQNTLLSTGQPIENDVTAIVQVWKADGKDFDIAKTTDMIIGYAYDKTSKVSIKSDYTLSNNIIQEAPAGAYFVFVIMRNPTRYGDLAKSCSYVTVNEGGIATIKKVFTTHATTGSYEDWDKPE